MAHPKKRSSKSRRDKRRTHVKQIAPPLVVCPVTGVMHMPHRAFWHEERLYYKGKVVVNHNEVDAST